MQDDDDAREQKFSDAEMIKIWIEAGIPTVIPGPVFRENVVPMGNTLFYQEANAGNLILTKVAGKTCVQIANGFAGQAIGANHEFTLEPHLVVAIGRLLLFKTVFGLNLAIWFGRGSVKWAEDDFMFRPRMLLRSKLERLGVVRRGGTKPVPRDRISPRGGTAVSQCAAICQHQRRHKECNAFQNHGDFVR
jgi:hypothetical protein